MRRRNKRSDEVLRDSPRAFLMVFCALSLTSLSLGCKATPLHLPAPSSRGPTPDDPTYFTAGVAQVDITPPPGLSLTGYGPEARRAEGYRTRLKARAIVLADQRGEKVAFVSLELVFTSVLIHRRVAELVHATTGIGADRLILGATHTHASPGNFDGIRAFDEQSSPEGGFNPEMVEFLSGRIAKAVVDAFTTRREAKLAWGSVAVTGVTENRSIEAFEANSDYWKNRFPHQVDPTLTMLRIDLLDPHDGDFKPEAALSIFALHGTGNPSANDLFDSDIHGMVAQRLESHIESLNGRPASFRPAAVHAVFNGAVGDVTPIMGRIDPTHGTPTPDPNCRPPEIVRVQRPAGLRAPPRLQQWEAADPDRDRRCIAKARETMRDLAKRLGDEMIGLHGGLKSQLKNDLEVSRVFHTVRVVGDGSDLGLCAPLVGTATVAGPQEDGRTRYSSWKRWGTKAAGFEEGGSAVEEDPSPDECHGEKRIFGGRTLQNLIAGDTDLVKIAQLAIIRIGPAVIGAIPFEATTVTGGMIREEIETSIPSEAGSIEQVAIIGIANGHNQYVATAAEYALQHYEGSSTLFGPKTAERLAGAMGELAVRLPVSGSPSPTPHLLELTTHPSRKTVTMPSTNSGPSEREIERRIGSEWVGGTLVICWNDAHPGRLIPADGPLLRIDRRVAGGGWEPLTWDGRPDMEVRAIREAPDGSYLWEARWRPTTGIPAREEVKVILLARPDLVERTHRPSLTP